MRKLWFKIGGLMLTLLAFAWQGKAQGKDQPATVHEHHDHHAHDHDHDHHDHNHAGPKLDPTTIPGMPHVDGMTTEQLERWELHQEFPTELGNDAGGYWALKDVIVKAFEQAVQESGKSGFNVHVFAEFQVMPNGSVEQLETSA